MVNRHSLFDETCQVDFLSSCSAPRPFVHRWIGTDKQKDINILSNNF